MDHVYAFGIKFIADLQNTFANEAWYFEMVNDLSVPSYTMDILFPLVAIFDSVFAAEFCLTCALGGWINSTLKWWFLEDRPYWWVESTDYYKRNKMCRPKIRQTRQTCETGPGCPSGHSEVAAMVLMMIFIWILNLMNDRRMYVWWWKLVAVPALLFLLISVMMARMYTAAHFPHQVVLGALLGLFLAPAITMHVVDPYVFRTGPHAHRCLAYTRFWHLVSVSITVFITYFTHMSFQVAGWDMAYTRKLAAKYCKFPKKLRSAKPPMFGLVLNNGHMFGWALACSPHNAQYRHFTKNRSIELAILATGLSMCFHNFLKKQNHTNILWLYYVMTFLIAAVKPLLLLKLVPFIATWPYTHDAPLHRYFLHEKKKCRRFSKYR